MFRDSLFPRIFSLQIYPQGTLLATGYNFLSLSTTITFLTLCSPTSQHGPLWSADIQRMQIHALVGAWYSSYDLSLPSRPRTCLATIYITAYGSGPTGKCEENNTTTTTNVNRSHHELSTSQHSGQILRPYTSACHTLVTRVRLCSRHRQ